MIFRIITVKCLEDWRHDAKEKSALYMLCAVYGESLLDMNLGHIQWQATVNKLIRSESGMPDAWFQKNHIIIQCMAWYDATAFWNNRSISLSMLKVYILYKLD